MTSTPRRSASPPLRSSAAQRRGDPGKTWLSEDRTRVAAERILDAAGDLFAEQGIGAVAMGDVARAAGCSRATLYRYFADRHELHVAYVHREARRVGGLVAADASRVRDPQKRLVTAVSPAVRGNIQQTLARISGSGDAPALRGPHKYKISHAKR